MNKTTVAGGVVVCAALAAAVYAQQAGVDPRPANAPDQVPAFAGQTDAPERNTNVAFDVVTVAQGLEAPWGLAFLPSGKMLVTEKPGRLRVVTPDGVMSPPVTGLPPLTARGQGGLLDVALDPSFATNQLIYWSFSEPHDDNTSNTAVARGRFVDGAEPRLENVQVIYKQSPSVQSAGHFGSRLAFGRDGTLFVTQGDRQNNTGRALVQQMDTLVGTENRSVGLYCSIMLSTASGSGRSGSSATPAPAHSGMNSEFTRP
jgi:glucose/arabinose dehydrogenase